MVSSMQAPQPAPQTSATPVPATTGSERRRRSRDKGLSLQINILTAFTLLLTVIVACIVTFAYQRNASSVLDLTQRFIDRVAISSIANTMSMFDPVAGHVRATADLAALDEKQGRDGKLFPYLTSILIAAPQLQSIYLAYDEDGRFLQAFPIPKGTEKFGANDARPPEGAEFAWRLIDRKNGVYSDVWTYVRRDGTKVGEETSNKLNYDPRPRPWYKDAIAKRGLIWSDLLVYTSNRQAGITAAYPVISPAGKVLGVAAANVTLNALSEFLDKLDLGSSGIALITDEKGQLIAFPDARRTVRQDGLKLSLVKAEEVNDPRITDAFAARQAQPGKIARFESQGKAYLGSFSTFPDYFGKNWLMTVIVLEDDFVGTLKDNNREIVAVGIGLTLLGLVVVSILAGWITRPLRLLCMEIQKIQRFDMAGPIALHAIVSEVNELIHSLNMMKRALRTFGMFVPRDLVRELVASGRPIELGGHDRTLTVMFTDIADFTTLSEQMNASDLLVHVSRHLAAMSECVGSEEGTVDKYIGDAVMAFWGAPTWHDDHALRACTAALKARHIQAQLNQEWQSQNLPTMYVRIGLHTSNVIVGNIGSPQRMSYTAVGDGVNVASRLEGVNKVYGSQICVSQAVLAAAGETVLARPLDRVAVKGRKGGETVYELVALRQGTPELLATPEQLEQCRLTQVAFDAYQAQDWTRAIELYEHLAGLYPADSLPAIFLQRCRQYRDAPPQDWSGVYEMKSK